MRQYRLTLQGPAGMGGPFMAVGAFKAWAIAQAYLLATQRIVPARCSIEALDVGGVTSFGLMPLGVVRIERLN